MTTLDASQSLVDFNMADETSVGFDVYLTSDPTAYHWQTASNGTDPINYVHAFGTGVTVDGSGHPTGGTITSLQVDMEHDAVIDVNITDVSVSLVTLLTPTNTNPTHADQFWETLLSGDDTIVAPTRGRSLMFGDFLDIHSEQTIDEQKTGGDDIISADGSADAGVVLSRGGAAPALIGDAFSVSGEAFNNVAYVGVLHGGDDTITLTGAPVYALAGDAYFVLDLGTAYGGNDTIRSDAHIFSIAGFGALGQLYGDAISNGGFVEGGDDIITGSNYAFLDELIAGDVRVETGASTGGKDTIHGRAGHDYIAGDTAVSGGFVTGGADKVYGGQDADIVSGDVLQAGNEGDFGTVGFAGAVRTVIHGGNDTIHGDQGDDIIAGDIYSFGSFTLDSEIHGGNDKLFGDEGDDTLYGDFGDFTGFFGGGDFFADGGRDTLTGGAGNDTQYGGAGNDTFIVALGSDSVDERIDGGLGADRIRFISQMAGDTLVLSDLVTNVETVEMIKANATVALNIDASHVGYGLALKGNAGANILKGTAFADTITGGAGKDAISGGGGADHFVYRAASDSTSTGYDTVNKADIAAVIWDVQGPIEAVDAKIATGALSAGNFDTQLGNAADDGHLGARHAVIFTPTSGGLAGTTWLIVDQNNAAGYQAGEDLVIQLTNAQHLSSLDVDNFV